MLPPKISKNNASFFHSLPDSVCLNIIEKVATAKFLCYLQLCDHRFNDLVVRTPTLSIKEEEISQPFHSSFELITTKLIMNCLNLVNLHVEFPVRVGKIQEITWLAWCMHFRESIEGITLVDAPNDYRDLENCGGWKIEHALKRCSKLKLLHLRNCAFLRSDVHFYRNHENLRHFTLQNSVISAESVRNILAHCPCIEEAAFLSCSGFGSLDLFDVPCSSLRKFELVTEFFPSSQTLELLRLCAPKLEILILVIDGIPGRRPEEIAERLLEIKSEQLAQLHLDLDGPFKLNLSRESIRNLSFLKILGDDWMWETVEFLLKSSACSLLQLYLHANILFLTALETSNFFESLQKIRVLSISHEIFYLLFKGLHAQNIPKVSRLEEIQIQYLNCSSEEVKFIEKLIVSAPNLRTVRLMITPLQLNATNGSGSSTFRNALTKLRKKFPGKQIL